MTSSSSLHDAVAYKLKYYMDVQRREEAFDLSTRNSSIYITPYSHGGATSGSVLNFERLKDRSLKHYFTPRMIRTQISNLETMPHGTQREQDIKRKMKKTVQKTSFDDILLTNPEIQSEAYRAQLRALRLLEKDTSRRLHRTMSPNSVKMNRTPQITRRETNRIINHASQILVATETVALAQEILNEQYDTKHSTNQRPKSAPTYIPPGQNLYSSHSSHHSYTVPRRPRTAKGRITASENPTSGKRRIRKPKYCWDLHGRRIPVVQESEDDKLEHRISSSYTSSSSLDLQHLSPHPSEFSRRGRPMSAKGPRTSPTYKDLRGRPFSADIIYVPHTQYHPPVASQYRSSGFSVDTATQTTEDVGSQTDLKGSSRKVSQSQPKICKYSIKIWTGDRSGAGTRADIYVVLRGERNKTEEMFLTKNASGSRPFRKGQVDEFKIEAEDIGNLKYLGIGHDQKERDFSWYVEQVEVDNGKDTWKFPCRRWFSGKVSDKLTFRFLKPAVVESESSDSDSETSEHSTVTQRSVSSASHGSSDKRRREERESSRTKRVSISSRSSHSSATHSSRSGRKSRMGTSRRDPSRSSEDEKQEKVSKRKKVKVKTKELKLKIVGKAEKSRNIEDDRKSPHKSAGSGKRSKSSSSSSSSSDDEEKEKGSRKTQLRVKTKELKVKKRNGFFEKSRKNDRKLQEKGVDSGKESKSSKQSSVVEYSSDSSTNSKRANIVTAEIVESVVEESADSSEVVSKSAESSSSSDSESTLSAGSVKNLGKDVNKTDAMKRGEVLHHRSNSKSSSDSDSAKENRKANRLFPMAVKVTPPTPPMDTASKVNPDKPFTDHSIEAPVISKQLEEKHDIPKVESRSSFSSSSSSSSGESGSEKKGTFFSFFDKKEESGKSSESSSDEEEIEMDPELRIALEKADQENETLRLSENPVETASKGQESMYKLEESGSSSSSSSESESSDEEGAVTVEEADVPNYTKKRLSIASVDFEKPTRISVAHQMEPELLSTAEVKEDIPIQAKVQRKRILEVVADVEVRKDKDSDSESLLSSQEGSTGSELSSSSSSSESEDEGKSKPLVAPIVEKEMRESEKESPQIISTVSRIEQNEDVLKETTLIPPKVEYQLPTGVDIHQLPTGVDITEREVRKSSSSSSSSSSSESEEEETAEEILLRGKDIHQAVLDDDFDRVKELVERVPHLKDEVNEKDWTPLHVAAANGRLRIVQWLATKGVDLNSETRTGYTSMHLAAMNGHLDCMLVLKSLGISVESKNVDGQTPLHVAAVSGQLDVVKWIVVNGGDYKLQDHSGRSVTELAKQYHHRAVLDFLHSYEKRFKSLQHNKSSSGSSSESSSSSSSSSSESENDEVSALASESHSILQRKREQEELDEKRRIYDEQRHQMKRRKSSFLEEIRMETEQEFGVDLQQ